MKNERIIATNLGALVGSRPGHGWCSRCGRAIRVRADLPVHVCRYCRSDREWLRAVSKGKPQDADL
jgi:DNA-directed RNA polymerase subunit RPC12/RpoP